MKYILILTVLLIACNNSKPVPKLLLTHDQLAQVLVELYSKDAAIDIQKSGNLDSLRAIYGSQVSQILNIDQNKIAADFETLLSMPDTLYKIQNMALDTLRTFDSNKYHIKGSEESL